MPDVHQSASQKTALILLVEPRIVEVSQRTLEGLGHRYLFARDHQEALEALKKEPVDLLIWTIRKKDEDFAFFDAAQKLCPACPGIAFMDESLEQVPNPELKSKFEFATFMGGHQATNHPGQLHGGQPFRNCSAAPGRAISSPTTPLPITRN